MAYDCDCLESDPFLCAARRAGLIWPEEVEEPCDCDCHTERGDESYRPLLECKIDDALEGR